MVGWCAVLSWLTDPTPDAPTIRPECRDFTAGVCGPQAKDEQLNRPFTCMTYVCGHTGGTKLWVNDGAPLANDTLCCTTA